MSHPDRSCAVPAYLLPPSLVRSDAKLNQASLYPLVISVNDGQPRTRAREDPKSSSPSCLGCFRTERAHRTLIGPHRSLTPIRQATGAVGRSAPRSHKLRAGARMPRWPESALGRAHLSSRRYRRNGWRPRPMTGGALPFWINVQTRASMRGLPRTTREWHPPSRSRGSGRTRRSEGDGAGSAESVFEQRGGDRAPGHLAGSAATHVSSQAISQTRH